MLRQFAEQHPLVGDAGTAGGRVAVVQDALRARRPDKAVVGRRRHRHVVDCPDRRRLDGGGGVLPPRPPVTPPRPPAVTLLPHHHLEHVALRPERAPHAGGTRVPTPWGAGEADWLGAAAPPRGERREALARGKRGVFGVVIVVGATTVRVGVADTLLAVEVDAPVSALRRPLLPLVAPPRPEGWEGGGRPTQLHVISCRENSTSGNGT